MNIKFKKIIYSTLIIIGALVFGFFLIFYSILNLSLPKTEGSISLQSIDANIEITYDKMGLPQIWAETESDGYFALGYVHASDRLFQMELIRRVAHGRISELLGEVALNHDKRQRLVGHAKMAAATVGNLNENDRNRLDVYAQGINQYYKTCSALPIEFYLMQLDFEPWTVTDLITILSFQSWFSDALMNRDLFFVKVAEKLGVEKAKLLVKDYPDWAPTTIEYSHFSKKNKSINYKTSENLFEAITDYKYSGTSKSLKESFYEQLFSNDQTPFTKSVSSNGWAVAPSRSESGKAILASDPHLEITRLPEFWYYVGLHIKETKTNILGLTTPGLPFVVMGHNSQAAFAFTAGGVDITEYYLEKINPEDSNQYLTENGWKNFIIETDTIKIAGEKSEIIFDIKKTRHGPVISELDSLNEIYSMRWAGFDIDLERAVQAGFELHRVDNFEKFRETVTALGALDANWIYADNNGNIGYQLGTPVPIRQKENSNLPLTGWSIKNEWLGFYPIDMTPHVLNPKQGWVGNCNNLSQRSNLSYKIDGNYFPDRILRLNELFNSQDKYNVSHTQKMQMDMTDSFLLRWRDVIASVFDIIGDVKHADRLREWDGRTTLDSRETLFIELFLLQLKKMIFEDELGKLYKQVRFIWMDQVINSNDLSWYDNIKTDDKIETKDDIMTLALWETLELLDPDKQTANDPEYYKHITWGNWHSLTIQHPMATIPILNQLLKLKFGPWKWAGTAGTMNASFFTQTDNSHFKSFVGPSWRFVIDFSKIDKATMVLPAGNSGNPYSEHFFDFNEMWQKGERWQVPISYDEVKKKTVSSLILKAKK